MSNLELDFTGAVGGIRWGVNPYIQGVANGGFEIRDVTNSASRFNISSGGAVTATVDMRSPIFYDSNDTGYYVDPSSNSRLNQLSIGSVNTSYSLYNNGNSYFNGSVEIDDTLYVSSGYSARAPIFYDRDNTGYYIDPAGYSQLKVLGLDGGYVQYGTSVGSPSANFGNGRVYLYAWPTASGSRIMSFKIAISTTWNWTPGFGFITADISFYFDGTNLYYPETTITSATGQARVNLGIGQPVLANGYVAIPIYCTNSNPIFAKLEGAPSFDWSVVSWGSWQSVTFPGAATVSIPGNVLIGDTGSANGSFRAPIFYDSNDTGYYLDPASTSNLNGLNLASDLSFGSQQGTWMTSSFMADSIGWNGSYGVYIGSNTLGYNSYLRGNGTFTNNVGTYDLLHLGNYTSYTVPSSRTITINGVGYDLSANRSWTITASETDTLATVTARGSTTSTGVGFNNYVNILNQNSVYWYNAGNGSYARTYYDGGTFNLDKPLWVTSNIYGDVFYDRNNSGYYIDPSSSSTVYQTNYAVGSYLGTYRWKTFPQDNGGGIDFYMQGTNSVDSVTAYLQMSIVGSRGFYWSGGKAEFSQDVRTPIYYDSNDTGYYVDPNGSSQMSTINAVRFASVMGSQSPDNSHPGYGIRPFYSWNIGQANNSGAGYSNGITIGSNPGDQAYGFQIVQNMWDDQLYFRRYNSGWQGWRTALDNTNYGGYCNFGANSVYGGIFYDGNNSSYYVDPNGASRMGTINADLLRSYGNLYLDNDYGRTVVGVYSSTRYQGVFAMGDSYKLPTDGTSTGSLYGLAWSHPNAGGVAGNLNTHGLLAMENGTWLASLTGSTRARDDMRAPIFYDNNNTSYYVDPAGSTSLSAVYANNWFRASGNTGLYGQDYGVHFYPQTASAWSITGSGGNIELQFRSNHNSTIRGYVYADTSNNIGFLTSGGGWRLRCDDSGNAIATGDVTAYSDRRVKENIHTIDNALDKVNNLRGVYYTRIDSEDKQRKVGVIAQETLEVLPEVVGQDTDGMYNVAYGNITAVLIEAIKEQQKQIEELKELVNQLIKK